LSFDIHCTYGTAARVVSKGRSSFQLYDISTVITLLEDNVDQEIVVDFHLSSSLRGTSDIFVVGRMFYKAKHRSTSSPPLYDDRRKQKTSPTSREKHKDETERFLRAPPTSVLRIDHSVRLLTLH
jgi:hypothetical protein